MKFFQKILNRIYGIKKNISFPKKRFTCVCGYRVSKGDEFCMRCGMRLRYGELEIEVSGSNTNEVKDVSKAMINELNLKELEITISNYKDTNLKENMTYSIVKSGLTNLTKQMASYYGKYKIRVNTLCPGGIDGHIAGSKKRQDKTFIKNY